MQLYRQTRIRNSVVSGPPGGKVVASDSFASLHKFEVAEIVDKRETTQGLEYLVKWAGKTDEWSTWEPVNNVASLYLVKSSTLPSSLLMRESRSRSRRKRTASHHDRRESESGLNKRPKESNSPSSDVGVNYTQAPSTRALTLQEVLNGVGGGLTVSVTNGQLSDIPLPKPSRPAVVQHPDHKAFLRKLAGLRGPPVTLRNEHTDDPCPPLNFEFIEEFVLGEGVPVWDDSASFGCECGPGGCTKNERCQCLEKLEIDDDGEDSFAELAYTAAGRLKPFRDNLKIIYECNELCSCGPSCGNKVVGNGRKIPLEVFMTKNKGWGLRSPEPIRKGTFIGKYLGEVVTHQEATARAADGDTRGSSYLFDLDMFTKDEEEDDEEEEREVENYSVDGRSCGAVTRFVNHSCDPNVDIHVVVSYRRDSIVYDLAMFTNKDVRAWEEITCSYTEEAVGNEVPSNSWPCHCGAANCRGVLW